MNLMKISAKGAKIRRIFFILDDVLVPGPVNPSLSGEKVNALLAFLFGLQERGIVQLYILAGNTREKAEEKISKAGLGKFFRPENIFFVTLDYINSKEEFDRARHLASLEKDPDFVDEFFKQKILTDLVTSGQIMREESVLVGHDLWLDAFYTSRFSGLNFVLVQESLSERHVPIKEKIRWLNTIELSEPDFRKIILGKMPQQGLKLLESRIFNRMKKELFSQTDFSGLAGKIIERRKSETNK